MRKLALLIQRLGLQAGGVGAENSLHSSLSPPGRATSRGKLAIIPRSALGAGYSRTGWLWTQTRSNRAPRLTWPNSRISGNLTGNLAKLASRDGRGRRIWPTFRTVIRRFPVHLKREYCAVNRELFSVKREHGHFSRELNGSRSLHFQTWLRLMLRKLKKGAQLERGE